VLAVSVVALSAAVVIPLAVVLVSVLSPTGQVWSHLWATRLPEMLASTVVLVVLVSLGSLVLGTGLAWLVSAYRFPGVRVLSWILVTPLAVPGYVMGFVWLDSLDGLGRAVQSIWICAGVLVLSLYPYVYLLARSSFGERSGAAADAARNLGCSPWRSFGRVALPLARPSIAAGVALVAMETLTDIGTVRLFDVSTVSDGIFRVWYGLGDRQAATELAALLVLVALVLVVAERRGRGDVRYTPVGAGHRRAEPIQLRGRRAAAAVGACLAVIGLAVGVPVVRLGAWAIEAVRSGRAASQSGGLGTHLGNTAVIALLATAACLAVGLLLALAVRWDRRRLIAMSARAATMGYAVPGPVVGIGVLVTLAALDRSGIIPSGVVLVGSLAGLVYALTVRFLAVGYQSSEAALSKIGPSMTASARTLGSRPAQVARRIELPIARSGLVVAAALVAVDVVKELPATLLLRPFGFDTLPVWVWQATSESRWVEAAIPALTIVAVASIGVAALLAVTDRRRPSPR